ncbi:MAG: gliding motility-associated C-terminal domain-containing protein [Bacteroidota bacterium]|nr:gliding motility-associated C-terminal domain-containing protein [Bacteroidota bacterium]
MKFSNYSGYHISCKGDNSGWISVDVSGGNLPYSFLWSTNQTTDSIYNLYAGLYSLTITDSLGFTETIQLNLLEPPTSLSGVIQATTNYNGFNISCFNNNDGGIREIPIGGVPPYSWYWNDTLGGEFLNNQMAGYYKVKLYDNNNCFWEDSIILLQPSEINVQISSVTDTCGKQVGEAFATTAGGVPPYQYNWSSSDTLSFAKELKEGNHRLVILDKNSCTDTAWHNIENLPGPLINFNILPNRNRLHEQLKDPFVFIDNTNSYWQNVKYWSWDFGDNNSGADSIAYHSYLDTGKYDVSLIVVTEYNCMDTITKTVLVDDYILFIPNAFTPFNYNTDNNIFYVSGYGIDRFLMNIYSRSGELLFESNSMGIGWNGRKQGSSEICPIGTYIYYIEIYNIYGEFSKLEGQVMLLR